MGLLISIIIPVLNEEANLKELLPLLSDECVEILVVDGGSSDRSATVARKYGAELIRAEKGRAVQSNAGAEAAQGDILYFLHADGRPPEGFANAIASAIRSGAVGGCFRMEWNDGHWSLRFMAWLTRFFGPRFRGGDQSLFVRTDVFKAIGAYAEWPLFEDVEIIERLRRQGEFAVLKGPLITSSRRYRKVGVWRLHWHYLVLHAMYRFNRPISRIRDRYDSTIGILSD